MQSLRLYLILGLCACACTYAQQNAEANNSLPLSNTVEPLVSEPIIWRQARRRSNLVDSCITNSGSTGTCLTRFKCSRQSGTVNGFCGTYGVCCETNMACGTASRQKRTIIRGTGAFNRDMCQYTIEAYSSNVQQVRIDFELFELPQPVESSTAPNIRECQDYFEANNFKLCGFNSGQHLYLPLNVAAGQDQITLNFVLTTNSAQSKWRLVVTQLEAPQANNKRKTSTIGFGGGTNSLQELRNIFASHHANYELLAPVGCHQYYTDPTFTIRSFNYQPLSDNSIYMQDTSYTICINPPSPNGADMIEYDFSTFSMSLQTGLGDGVGYDADCHTTVHTEGRAEDFLMIPQSTLASSLILQPTHYCGQNSKFQVLAMPPYILHFNSDKMTLDASKESGFSFTYRLFKQPL